jgi:hypothetical protein
LTTLGHASDGHSERTPSSCMPRPQQSGSPPPSDEVCEYGDTCAEACRLLPPSTCEENHLSPGNGLTCSVDVPLHFVPPSVELQPVDGSMYKRTPLTAPALQVLISPGRHSSAPSICDHLWTPQSNGGPTSIRGDTTRMWLAPFQSAPSTNSSSTGSPLPVGSSRSVAMLSTGGDISLARDLGLSAAVIKCDSEFDSLIKSGSEALAGMVLPQECSSVNNYNNEGRPLVPQLSSCRLCTTPPDFSHHRPALGDTRESFFVNAQLDDSPQYQPDDEASQIDGHTNNCAPHQVVLEPLATASLLQL